MEIAKNKVVQIHYSLRNDAGDMLDTSQGKTPLAYLHGVGQIVSGLENALTGKKAGDAFKIVVNPEEGYGTKKDDLIQQVPKSGFQGGGEPSVGMQVQFQAGEEIAVGVITHMEGDLVTIDFNHPLAGANLHFEIEVVNVRNATLEELSHGHAHGEGGHHH